MNHNSIKTCLMLVTAMALVWCLPALGRAETLPEPPVVANTHIDTASQLVPDDRPMDDTDAATKSAVVEPFVMPEFQSPGDGIIEQFDFAALTKLTQKSSLVPIFEKGGPIMWPLLLASILALGAVIDRLFFLLGARIQRDRKGLRNFFAAISKGNYEKAMQIGQRSNDYVLRTLVYALTHKEKSLANALVYAQEQEMKRFRRGIPILDTIITLAPLLGLLGTVTGMMGSFALIGGELSAPGAITGGIAEALIATAFGLGIAITSLLPFNYLNTRMEEARLEIETAATQLEMMIQTQTSRTRVNDPVDMAFKASPKMKVELAIQCQ